MNEVVVSSASLMPQTFEQKYQMANVLVKSGLLPQGLNSPEKVCVALQWGHELGLSPMVAVNNIAVINGKPTLSADIMAAVAKRSPEYGGIEWIKNSETEAECKITRILTNGKTESITSHFTIEDAQKAGLTGKDVWRKYPKRMLKHRCLSYGLKDMFPDILAGLYTPEEMESGSTEQVVEEKNITPVSTPSVEPKVIEPVEQVVETVDSSKDRLMQIMGQYKESINPKYLAICENALQENNESAISDCLNRVVVYLGKKGIKVA